MLRDQRDELPDSPALRLDLAEDDTFTEVVNAVEPAIPRLGAFGVGTPWHARWREQFKHRISRERDVSRYGTNDTPEAPSHGQSERALAPRR